jgi:hypothetical protein
MLPLNVNPPWNVQLLNMRVGNSFCSLVDSSGFGGAIYYGLGSFSRDSESAKNKKSPMRFSNKMTRSPVSFYLDEKSLNYYRYYEKLAESLNKLDVRMKALNVELDGMSPVVRYYVNFLIVRLFISCTAPWFNFCIKRHFCFR